VNAWARKGGLLYPMLLIAAITVIVFSAMGIATMLGWLPAAYSGKDRAPPAAVDKPIDPAPATDAPRLAPAGRPGEAAPNTGAGAPGACGDCGVVESIRAVEVSGQGSWFGAAGGALVGGLLGNQVGRGLGRTAATVAGAGAGAYAGNEIERNITRSVRYEVRVRMEDGSHRKFYRATRPQLAVGQKVRVTEQGILAAG